MNETQILEVGDMVLVHSRMGGWGSFKVDRVTSSQAILSDGTKLKRSLSDGSASIGAGSFPNYRYYLATPENIQRATHSRNLQYLTIHNVQFKEFPMGNDYESISRIVAIHKAAMVQINDILNGK